MTTRLSYICGLTVGLICLLVIPVDAEIEIVLQKGFVHTYKDRATIDVNYIVDKAHAHPNPPSKDGDMHIAGRAEEVKLPIVAEIMNARDEGDAVDLIHNEEGSEHTISMKGAWRIWCEHGGSSRQVQGEPLEPFETTNPDHVFEIHPVTHLGQRGLLKSLKVIQGFDTKDAEAAFTKYENIPCKLETTEHDITIRTGMAGYNYVEFGVSLSSREKQVDDGRFVMGDVCDLEGELLVRNRRMVFVKDSEPELKTRGVTGGKAVHLLGIPRVNLALVDWRCAEAARESGNRDVLEWSLPYEIVVVGYYGELREDETEITDNRAVRPTAATQAGEPFIPRDVRANRPRRELFERAADGL